MKLIFATILINIFFLSSVFGIEISKKEKSDIESLLAKQVEAWNEGDLEKFMETYWNSEKLSFVGSRGPSYGWQATLENYKKGYPDKAAMGSLAFDILKISKIDRKTIYVIGKFELTREAGDLSGHFTLVIQKIKGQWLIVSDHSSSAA
jgi:hypothetical protein